MCYFFELKVISVEVYKQRKKCNVEKKRWFFFKYFAIKKKYCILISKNKENILFELFKLFICFYLKKKQESIVQRFNIINILKKIIKNKRNN